MTAEIDPKELTRADFRHFLAIPTRWMDNDVYGHVNNVVYYSYFDTLVNENLIRHGVLDLDKSEVIGIVAETRCRFLASLAFPEPVEGGLRVARLGRSSVTYEIGLFKEGHEAPAAFGRFVHVYVARTSMTPVAIPAPIRALLDGLRVRDHVSRI
ncbi:MAG: acyl-CoA thioesterase [Rhodospirillales bacterium]|nr:acyl-CoA thioesterase [Rhodospirillales bacterium]